MLHAEPTMFPTRTMTRMLWRFALPGALMALLLVGCGSDAPTLVESTPEVAVEHRAQARWDALIAGDVEKAYGYTSPAYRSTRDLNQFRARFGTAVRHTGAEVSRVECDEERCSVMVMVTYEVPQLGTGNTRALRETWIHSAGEWWIHLD